MNNVIPNFFIIGAIKSGTTTLANFLINHPDVFMPGTSEINYLASDLIWTSLPPVINDEGYFSCFQNGIDKKCIGEKSVFYLYSSEAAKRIYEINPDAKLICILREPVSLLWSLYKYNISNFEEDILDFKEALTAENDRKTGKRIPGTGTIVQNTFYREIIQFDKQLEVYFKLFPKKQIKIYLFDDLITDQGTLYQDMLSFLNLDFYPLPAQKKYNPGNRIEVYQARLLLHQYPRLKCLWNILPAAVRTGIKKFITVFKGKEPVQLSRIPPEIESTLYQETGIMITNLSSLIEKDLSDWKYQSTSRK